MPKVTLYHGTNKKRLASIREKGLDPKAQKASSGDDFVYLTDNIEVAAEFSGYGKDSQGTMREGYMTPLEGKKQNGVILKVEVDSKFLKPDAIWAKKLKELKNRDKTIEALKAEIYSDINGNQILEWHANELAYKMAQEDMKENPEEYDEDSDVEFVAQDYWESAADEVALREATKIVDSQLKELKKFAKGKLYQCAKAIPPSAIIDEIPSKTILKKAKDDGDRNFGNNQIDVMGGANPFLVRARKQLGRLYHFISVDNLDLALINKRMKPLAGSQPMDFKKDQLHYKNDSGESIFYGISTTRMANWKPNAGTYWAEIRITFDGDSLSDKYPIKSYNDFWKWDNYIQKKISKDPFYHQAEEKIITNRNGLPNFLKYVLEIQVLNSIKDEFLNAKLDEKLKDKSITFVDAFTRK